MEKAGIALEVLRQDYGPSFGLVAYLSKQLDDTTKGWPTCLRVSAAAAFLTQESKKLTFGQSIIHSPHSLLKLLSHRTMKILCPSKLQLLHATFIKNPNFIVVTNLPLNPATLLPTYNHTDLHPLLH